MCVSMLQLQRCCASSTAYPRSLAALATAVNSAVSASYQQCPCSQATTVNSALCVQAFVWQVKFHSAPSALTDVDHDLRTDERVIRYIVTKADESVKMKQWRIFQQYAEGTVPHLTADNDMQLKSAQLQQAASKQ